MKSNGNEDFHTCKIDMAAGEVKKVRLRFVVLIYRILALFLCHQSRIPSFAYCFIGVWNSFTSK